MKAFLLRRWTLAGVVVLAGCGPGLTQGPPQFLPITAQWCLEGPPPARCIQLEVPRGERQQAMGMQLRPPLPHLRGMWFPNAPATVARFWMHRTPEPIDMLFIEGGRVVFLERSVPPCMSLPLPQLRPRHAGGRGAGTGGWPGRRARPQGGHSGADHPAAGRVPFSTST